MELGPDIHVQVCSNFITIDDDLVSNNHASEALVPGRW